MAPDSEERPIVISVLIVLILIALNAMFVAAEFALIGSSRATLDTLSRQGNSRAKTALKILESTTLTDRYIATAQLGITFASLGLGMYGEHQFAGWLERQFQNTPLTGVIPAHIIASILSLSALTYLHIVLGEMIPKTLALLQAETTVQQLVLPMRWAQTLMLPLVIGLDEMGHGLLRIFGIHPTSGHNDAPTPEDLAYIVDESVEGGRLGELPGEVFDELLAFGERTAAEVMTPRVKVIGLRRGSTPEQLREILQRFRHTRYPVYERNLDDLVGFVHIRDLLNALVEDEPLTQQFIRNVPYVPASMKLDAVLARMRSEKTHLVVVMDEHGGTAGILTIEDIFEEVIGEISDTPEKSRPIQSMGGYIRASGQARLDEIGDEIGQKNLSHPDVDTVSGLILASLQRPPLVGDIVEWNNLRFRVLSIEGHGVLECEVYPLTH